MSDVFFDNLQPSSYRQFIVPLKTARLECYMGVPNVYYFEIHSLTQHNNSSNAYTPYDLTGATVEFSVKRRTGENPPFITKVASLTDATMGLIKVQIDEVDLNTLSTKWTHEYSFNLKVTNGSIIFIDTQGSFTIYP